LQGESRAEFDSLFNILRETLQPEGALEEILVEKLAMILWRHRRLISAEAGEIAGRLRFIESDKVRAQESSADTLIEFGSAIGQGMIKKISNPRILERCLLLLHRLRRRIETEKTLDLQRDIGDLKTIYGSPDPQFAEKTFFEKYLAWHAASTTSERERQAKSLPSPEQCCGNVLMDLKEEIQRLEDCGREEACIATEKTRVEILRLSVPEGPGLERVIRYEASLERAFDRTLSQLERLQRMRQGQPVAPRIDVNLSS
jgi:hypothetical protein